MSTPNPPNVLVLLPARARQAIYVLYGLAVLVNSSTLVGFAAGGYAIPAWLLVAGAVVGSLGIPVSSLAATNVPKPLPEAPVQQETPEEVVVED